MLANHFVVDVFKCDFVYAQYSSSRRFVENMLRLETKKRTDVHNKEYDDCYVL